MASNTTTIQTLPYGSDPTTPNTTFVQADPSNFRAVVQKLTGASDDPSAPKLPLTLPARLMAAQNHRPNSSSSTAAAADIGPKRPTFKLHERRHCTAKKLELNVGVSSGMIRGAGGGIVMMGSPVSAFELAARGSPRTPKEEEEKAIAEKGFYLHPSPLNTPRGSDPPELLPLFPLHSPKQH
ncbi:VQ motif-containing protein 11-like [Senna tora]|uniref:VQ motif-containing protein 11-like n=1 Tax=Senna tora TaxID=362788 RepID=A0A834T344_9FABA|nr:VQ motif-containing protein 11-like [Senna tora]